SLCQGPLPHRPARVRRGPRPRQLQAAATRAVPPLNTEGPSTMRFDPRPLAAAALAALLIASPAAAPAQSFSGDQRGEIERIVREYLLSHPELLQEVMTELEKRQAAAETEKHRAAVQEDNATICSLPP